MDELEGLKEFRASLPAPDTARVGKMRAALNRAMDEARVDDAQPKALRSRIRTPRSWALAAGTAAVAIAVAVVVLPVSREPVDSGTASDIVYGDALMEFPYETASDVVSYADQVSLVTAISATVAPDDVPAGEAGGGLITRDVTFRIDRTLWHRSGAPTITGTFVANRGGWLSRSVNDGPKIQSRFALHGAPWFDVGSQYVMPLAFNNDKWGPIMPLAEFPYVESTVRPAETQETPLARELRGASLVEIGAAFTVATADPIAVKHFDLQPSARLKAVLAEQGQ